MRVRTTLILLLLSLVMVACTIGPEREKAPSVHLLEWQGELDPAGEALASGLQIAGPKAYPGHGSARMAYRQSGRELRYFANNRWVASPADLIGAALTEAMADSGLFSDVAAPGSAIRMPYRLDVDVIRLEQHFDDDGSHVRLTLRYRLVDAGNGRSLGHLRQDLRQDAGSGDPAGGVVAANEALAESIRALVATLPEWLD